MALGKQELETGFRIGDSLIEPRQNRIVRGDSDVRVEPRVMDVLVCLAQRAGEVVSRDTLNREVWGAVVVTDQAVTNCISELRQHLGDDRATNRVIETIPKRGYRLTAAVQVAGAASAAPAANAPISTPATVPPPPAPTPRAPRWPIGAAALIFLAGLLGLVWWWKSAASPTLTSVAVVPFENAANDESLNYLALAVPDEIATLLTKSRGLTVRPQIEAADPLAAARASGVGHIVTGRFYLEDDRQLSLAIEAQQVPQARVVWRTRITAPAGDLLGMRAQLADAVQRGLLPALGATVVASGNTPVNEEAYQLYLRSLALPQQPKQTERAIELLERATALEPTFAPAWQALGLRYYETGTWFTTGSVARQKSLAAHRKALELDPQFIGAARNIVTRRAESGDLEGAYGDARQLFDRFGPVVETHFALSYVYRFGGMMDDAIHQCELALALDAQDPRLRSCANNFMYANKLDRVMPWLALDEGAYFVQWATVLYQLRRDDRDAALAVTRQAADEPTRQLMLPCLEGARGAELDDEVAGFLQHWERSGDPETAYAVAPILAWCGRHTDALRLVERSIDLGFCPYPSLDVDPIWKSLRDEPEFKRVRARAVACHDAFRRVVESFGQRG